MCRILLVRSDQPFNIIDQLKPFAQLSQNSREYQGHGWGCAWLSATEAGASDEPPWRFYHCIKPVWEDELDKFGSTTLLLAHARSAFRDEGIVVENNMPFSDGKSVFIFNGELRGVRINSPGRIGAEKIYNYIRRMDKGDLYAALAKAAAIIAKRTNYVRAMNILMSDGQKCLLSTAYNEDPEYFQLYRDQQTGLDRVCSETFPGESGWRAVPNNSTLLL